MLRLAAGWIANFAIAGFITLSITGCVQPYVPGMSSYLPGSMPSGRSLVTQDQTAGIEEQDRINRFRRLAAVQGVAQPTVEALLLPAGSTAFMSGPVPVVRVVFPELAFFAFDSADPLPASQSILDVIAEDMKRDVPDAAMTVLGHTDAVGTDAYNIDLSRRRAATVIAALITRGVHPQQLTEVAIGKRQPIAPNDIPQGRALNRRVEFLISPGVSANLAAVQQRVVPSSFFETRPPDAVKSRTLMDDEPLRRVPSSVTQLLQKGDAIPALRGMNPSISSRADDPKPAPLVLDVIQPRLPSVAEVYQAAPTARAAGQGFSIALQPLGGLLLSPVAPSPAAQEPVQNVAASQRPHDVVALAPTMPVVPVQLIPPDKIIARTVDPSGPSL